MFTCIYNFCYTLICYMLIKAQTKYLRDLLPIIPVHAASLHWLPWATWIAWITIALQTKNWHIYAISIMYVVFSKIDASATRRTTINIFWVNAHNQLFVVGKILVSVSIKSGMSVSNLVHVQKYATCICILTKTGFNYVEISNSTTKKSVSWFLLSRLLL